MRVHWAEVLDGGGGMQWELVEILPEAAAMEDVWTDCRGGRVDGERELGIWKMEREREGGGGQVWI